MTADLAEAGAFVDPPSRVREAADLAGLRIGVPESQMTAAVWDPWPALSRALLHGEIDALMVPRGPSVFRCEGGGVRRVFPGYAERKTDYYQRTGIFPIMHLVVVRADAVRAYPWVAAASSRRSCRSRASRSRAWPTPRRYVARCRSRRTRSNANRRFSARTPGRTA